HPSTKADGAAHARAQLRRARLLGQQELVVGGDIVNPQRRSQAPSPARHALRRGDLQAAPVRIQMRGQVRVALPRRQHFHRHPRGGALGTQPPAHAVVPLQLFPHHRQGAAQAVARAPLFGQNPAHRVLGAKPTREGAQFAEIGCGFRHMHRQDAPLPRRGEVPIFSSCAGSSSSIGIGTGIIIRAMDPAAFRRHGHALVEWIADSRARVETLPVLSQATPGEVRAALPARAPEHGEEFAAVMADVDRVLLPGLTHWQSPNFFAYFPANSSEPSILGELLSAGLGVQGMLWDTSPACTELETLMLDWLVAMLDLPPAFLSTSAGGGVIQDTASSAVLCALIAARERATRGASNEQGLAQCGAPALVAYASSQAHSSVEKAATIAGIGRRQ